MWYLCEGSAAQGEGWDGGFKQNKWNFMKTFKGGKIVGMVGRLRWQGVGDLCRVWSFLLEEFVWVLIWRILWMIKTYSPSTCARSFFPQKTLPNQRKTCYENCSFLLKYFQTRDVKEWFSGPTFRYEKLQFLISSWYMLYQTGKSISEWKRKK